MTGLPQTRSSRIGYRPELDGIRALAVLAVMVFHIFPLVGGYDFMGGLLGVDVFFVLSGYLITTLLLRERSDTGIVSFRNFYIRRALRLLPALLVTFVLAGYVVGRLKQPFPRPFHETVLLSISYIGNWFQTSGGMGILGHTWSLAIEEQYYLVWPAVLVASLRRSQPARIAGWVLGAAAVVGLLRFAVFSQGYLGHAALTTFTRSDGVLIGSALALLLVEPSRRLRAFLERGQVALIAAATIFAIALSISWQSPVLYRGGFTVVNLCTAICVGHLVLRPDSIGVSVLAVRPLAAIGRISYGLYLLHVPVMHFVHGRPGEWFGLGAVATFFALTFLVAGASYLGVEQPVLRLKDRFITRPAAAERPLVGTT